MHISEGEVMPTVNCIAHSCCYLELLAITGVVTYVHKAIKANSQSRHERLYELNRLARRPLGTLVCLSNQSNNLT